MTFVVPFDGSELAEAALVRATEFGTVLDERVLAVCVVPRDAEYARERGWLDDLAPFEVSTVVSHLHEQVTRLCPSANFRHEAVDGDTTPGAIAELLREVAIDEDASMVFVGSENAGHVVSTVGSVGRSVVAENAYDVVIVRDRTPARVEKVRRRSPYRKPKSDFYLS